MKIPLTENEIGILKVALYLAQQWEDSCIEAYEGVPDYYKTDWDDETIQYLKLCRKNIRDFKRLHKKLFNINRK